MKYELEFAREKGTKGTIRYAEVGEEGPESENKVGTLYVKRTALGLTRDDDPAKAPATLKVTIES